MSWWHHPCRSVHPHMPIQIPALREPQQTQFTLIRFFPTVYPQMLGQGAAVGERFFAQSTSVGALPGVRPHVRCH